MKIFKEILQLVLLLFLTIQPCIVLYYFYVENKQP